MINHLHGIGFGFSLSVYYAFRQKKGTHLQSAFYKKLTDYFELQ